jgi:hypothetical protein
MIKCKAPRMLICEWYIPCIIQKIERMEWPLPLLAFPFLILVGSLPQSPLQMHIFATCSLFDQKLVCSLVAPQYAISTPSPPAGVWASGEILLIPANQIPFLLLNSLVSGSQARGPPIFFQLRKGHLIFGAHEESSVVTTMGSSSAWKHA